MNPLIPTAYDVVMSALVMLAIVYSIAAIISMLRIRSLNGGRFLVWLLLVLAAPVLGATAWFVYGRRSEALRP